MLVERGIISENLPPAEDVKKMGRKLESNQKKCWTENITIFKANTLLHSVVKKYVVEYVKYMLVF